MEEKKQKLKNVMINTKTEMSAVDVKRLQVEQTYYAIYGKHKSFDDIMKDRMMIRLKSGY